MNKKNLKKRIEKQRLEPKRKARYADLTRPTQTEWRSRDEVAPVVEVGK